LDSKRGATRRFPKSLYNVGKISKQQKKFGEDARPQKVMHGSTRPLGVVVLKVVVTHVLTKP
jgi:hypothetical protein